MQNSITEAMCITDPGEEYLSKAPDLNTYQAVAIGMGVGQHKETEKTNAKMPER